MSAKNAWHNGPRSVTPNRQDSRGYFQKNWAGMCGTLPETLTLFQTKICDFPYPISDLIKNLIPYFRPEALEPGAWPEPVTSCYGTYTVVGVNIKKEMVLLPNDEEVANSSKKHTQFKKRVHKRYPISDQNGRNWCPISDQNGWKTILLGAAHTHIAYIGTTPRSEKRVADYVSRCLRKPSLRSKRFQSSYCAKVRAGALQSIRNLRPQISWDQICHARKQSIPGLIHVSSAKQSPLPAPNQSDAFVGERSFSKSWGLRASVFFFPIPIPIPSHSLFFALVPTFAMNSRGNACYAG